MSRQNRKLRNNQQGSLPFNLASTLELAVYLMLCFQIVATAIYYNGIIEPLAHKVLLGQALGLAAWFFFGLHALAARRLVLRHSPYYLPLIVLCAWAGFRSITAPNANAVRNYWIFLNFIWVFPLWVTCFRSRYFRSLFIWTVIFTGVVMIVGCIRQILMVDPKFTWEFFPAMTLSGGSYDRQRLGSFMGHNNHSTAQIAIALIYAGLMWVRFRDKLWSMVFGVFIVLSLMFIILGGSRAVALMVLAALLVLVAGWKIRSIRGMRFSLDLPALNKTKKMYGLGALAIVSLLVMAISLGVYKSGSVTLEDKQIQSVWSRFGSPTEHLISGTYPRVWLMSLLMARDNPLLGVGFSAWSYRYPDYQEAWFTKYPDTKIGLPILGQHSLDGHNDYLQLWAELGWIGLLCLVWLLWIHFRSLGKIYQAPSISPIALFALAATVATLAQAIFAFPFHIATSSCLFIANVGLVSSMICTKEWTWEPNWLAQTDWSMRGTASVFVLVILGVLSYPIWVILVAEFAARSHGIQTDYARFYRDKGDMEQYAIALERGYKDKKFCIEWLPNQGKYLHEIGAETVIRGIYGNDNETLLTGIDYLKRSQKSYSFYRTYEHLGQAYRRLWENTLNSDYLENALAAYRKASAIMPTCANAWVQQGLLLGKSGQTQECLDLLSSAELRFPGFIERDLIHSAKTEPDLKDKVMLFDLAGSILPHNESILRDVLTFYLVELKRMDRAVDLFTHMAQYQQPEPVVNWMKTLLLAQMQNGMQQEALNMMRKLRKLASLRSIKEVCYYAGLVEWITGSPWQTLCDWGTAREQDIPLEQLEPPLSTFLNHLLVSVNAR